MADGVLHALRETFSALGISVNDQQAMNFAARLYFYGYDIEPIENQETIERKTDENLSRESDSRSEGE